MNDDPAGLLRGVPLFATINEEALAMLAQRLRRRAFRRNEVIFHHGDPAGAMHVIRSGRVKLTLPSEEGEETVVRLMTTGDVFGEMGALTGVPRSATVTAVEATETVALLREDLLSCCLAHPQLALAVIEELSDRLRHMNDLLEEAYFLGLEARLARRLVELMDQQGQLTEDGIEFPFPLTQTDLAGMLGVTRVSVNRLLGAFQDERLIRLNRGSITVLQPEALRRRAGW